MQIKSVSVSVFFLLIVTSSIAVGQYRNVAVPSITNNCDYCIGSQGLTPVDAGQSGIAYTIRYLSDRNLYILNTSVANTRNAVESSVTHQFSLYYNISKQFSAVIDVPFVSRSESGLGTAISMTASSQKGVARTLHNTMSSSYSEQNSGLSDIRVVGKYKFFSTEVLSFSLLGGLKLPTGNTAAVNQEQEQYDPHMQLGSGSVDPLIGLSAYYAVDEYSIAFGSVFVSPTVGADNYRFGQNINVDATLRYSVVTNGSSTLFACFGLMGESHSTEKQNGNDVPNTGGTTLYCSPGVRYLLNRSLAVEAGFDYPLYHDLRGMQLGESYRFTGGVQYSF